MQNAQFFGAKYDANSIMVAIVPSITIIFFVKRIRFAYELGASRVNSGSANHIVHAKKGLLN